MTQQPLRVLPVSCIFLICFFFTHTILILVASKTTTVQPETSPQPDVV